MSIEQKTPFLSIEDLVVKYTSDGQTIHAVNGVSLTLERGKTLGLVGETGAGKTTIAKTILRILPDRAAKVMGGKISVDGKDLLALTEDDMRHYRGNLISMIFQDPMTALNPTMRVGDQISEVVRIHNDVSKAEAEARAKEMLAMVGISEDRFKEYPHQFSGGMKQRVVIAMALACDPELLLADEPTTALDVTIQAQVLDLIRELRDKLGTSMILITHDLGIVAETCDTVAVIYAGKIVEYGKLEDIFDNPKHPYTLGLFGSLPEVAEGQPRLNSIKGLPPDPTNLPEGCAFWPRCPHATERCKQAIPNTEITPGHFVRCIKEVEANG